MKKYLAVVAGVLALSFITPVLAADDSMNYISREKWERMSPKEREAVREKRHAEWAKMTPEQRKALKEKRKEEFAKLPPEEQKTRKEAHEKRMARRTEWKEKYAKATPEEKAKMRADLAAKRKAREEGAAAATPSAGSTKQ